MARVLMVGLDPSSVDFSDPALPPGLDAETIRHGIARGLADLHAAGHEAEYLDISPDPARVIELAERLEAGAVDCVVIGGGVRVPPRNLVLFEAVLNVVAKATSRPAIALVSRPEEAALSVARVMRVGG